MRLATKTDPRLPWRRARKYNIKATEWVLTPGIAPYRPDSIEVESGGLATAASIKLGRRESYATLAALLEVFKLDGQEGGDLVSIAES